MTNQYKRRANIRYALEVMNSKASEVDLKPNDRGAGGQLNGENIGQSPTQKNQPRLTIHKTRRILASLATSPLASSIHQLILTTLASKYPLNYPHADAMLNITQNTCHPLITCLPIGSQMPLSEERSAHDYYLTLEIYKHQRAIQMCPDFFKPVTSAIIIQILKFRVTYLKSEYRLMKNSSPINYSIIRKSFVHG